MSKNIFQTDTQKTAKRKFLEKTGGIFVLSIFLTGLYCVSGFFFFTGLLQADRREMMKAADIAWKCFSYFDAACIFISLIKIALDEKPFSKTLVYCIRVLGVLGLIASVLIPRLSGYRSSGFELFASGRFVLIDGMLLLPALLLLILSYLIKEGFQMQKEMDEIL